MILLKKKDEELFDFEFQCIYINPSYLTGGFFNINDTIDNIKDQLYKFNKKFDGLINFISNLNLHKDKLDEFSNIIGIK